MMCVKRKKEQKRICCHELLNALFREMVMPEKSNNG